jgi:hypothetical protein
MDREFGNYLYLTYFLLMEDTSRGWLEAFITLFMGILSLYLI